MNDTKFQKALFIGRFQPFHLGHKSVIEKMASNNEIGEIIIGIGSSQEANTLKNPFTFEERKEMIKKGLNTKDVKIIAIPDIHDDNLWVSHVEKCVGEFDLVFTGNEWVDSLFRKFNYEIIPLERLNNLSATQVRIAMLENKDWEKYLPEGTVKVIKSINGQQKLQLIKQGGNSNDGI